MSTPSFALATTSTQQPRRETARPKDHRILGPVIDLDPDDDSEDDIQPIVKRTSAPQVPKDDLWRKVVVTRAAASSQLTAVQKGKMREVPDQNNDVVKLAEPDADPRPSSYLGKLQQSRMAAAVAPEDPDLSGGTTKSHVAQPFSRIRAMTNKVGRSAITRESSPSALASEESGPKGGNDLERKSKLFSGKTFVILAEVFGEDDLALRRVLDTLGAEILTVKPPAASPSTDEMGKAVGYDADEALTRADFVVARLKR